MRFFMAVLARFDFELFLEEPFLRLSADPVESSEPELDVDVEESLPSGSSP